MSSPRALTDLISIVTETPGRRPDARANPVMLCSGVAMSEPIRPLLRGVSRFARLLRLEPLFGVLGGTGRSRLPVESHVLLVLRIARRKQVSMRRVSVLGDEVEEFRIGRMGHRHQRVDPWIGD